MAVSITHIEYERKGIALIWKLENLGNIQHTRMEFFSPVFSLDMFEGTKWRLRVHQITLLNICLTLEREAEDNGPEEFKLYYQFSVGVFNNSDSTYKTGFCAYTYRKNQQCKTTNLNYKRMISSNTATIQCNLWRACGSIENSSRFFAQTRLATNSYSFFGRVENFSDFYENNTKQLKVVLSPTDEPDITMNLSLITLDDQTDERIMNVEIGHLIYENDRLMNIRTFFLDSLGNKMDFGNVKVIFRLKDIAMFELPGVWKQNAYQYLTNDTLSLCCDFELWSGVIDHTVFENGSFVSEVIPADFSEAVGRSSQNEGTSCGSNLQTTTNLSSADYANVLRSHSHVFEAIYESKTREGGTPIPDEDFETLKRMLTFWNIGTLDGIEWTDARKLYIAADKYQMPLLQQKCRVFLKENIDLSNCCVLLRLADVYQDNDLDRAAKTFVTEYASIVLNCDQWRSLERNIPHLAIETLRHVCFQNIKEKLIILLNLRLRANEQAV